MKKSSIVIFLGQICLPVIGLAAANSIRPNFEVVAVQLLLKMPASNNANRVLCIYNDGQPIPKVVGMALGSWNTGGITYVGRGLNFPIFSAKATQNDSRIIQLSIPKGAPGEAAPTQIGVDPQDGTPIFAASGFVRGIKVEVCAYESRALHE